MTPIVWPVLALTVEVVVVSLLVGRGVARHPAMWLSLLFLGSTVASLFVRPTLLATIGLGIGSDDGPVLLAYGIGLVAFLFPAVLLRNNVATRFKPRLVVWILRASAPFVLFSFFYLAPVAWETVGRNAHEVRVALNMEGVSALPGGGLTTIAVAVAQFYFVFAFLFVLATAYKLSRWLRGIAFLGSTLYILNALSFAARDGVIWFAGAYLWALWYAGPTLAPELRKRVRRAVVPALTLGVLAFLLFSVQRFGDRPDGTVIDHLVSYYGQQPYAFATGVSRQRQFYGGRLRFPVLMSLTSGDASVKRTESYEWTFGTFLKDFYGTGGWPFFWSSVAVVPALIGMLIVVLRGFPEGHALISLVYVQFMMQGVFYFRMGTRAGNVYLLVMIVGICISIMLRTPTGKVRKRNANLAHSLGLRPGRHRAQ